MKIVHLQPGDLFQFKHQRKPDVFRVLDPSRSYYEIAGFYDRGLLRATDRGHTVGWWNWENFDHGRDVRTVVKPCPDSPTGMHDFSPDVEYDSANPPMNCEHCGDEEPQS